MTTRTIRQKLHSYLELADDKKVKAMYAIMEDAIEDMQAGYPEDFKKELDARFSAYKNGTAKQVSAEESKKRVRKILKGIKSK